MSAVLCPLCSVISSAAVQLFSLRPNLCFICSVAESELKQQQQGQIEKSDSSKQTNKQWHCSLIPPDCHLAASRFPRKATTRLRQSAKC